MTVIPCEQDPRLRAEIERFAEVLKTQAHRLGDHGLDETSFYSSPIFRGAIEKVRGEFSATMRGKREFVQHVLNHMQDRDFIADWDRSQGKARNDYYVRLKSGRLAVIDLKGCLDGENTNKFERPADAEEFITWSLCTNSGADPRRNAWSGIHTRLSAEMISRNKRVDGVIIWDMICGTLGRPCPKLAALGGAIGERSWAPSSLRRRASMSSRRRSRPPLHPQSTAQTLTQVELLAAFHEAFGGRNEEVNYVDFEVGEQADELFRRTTIRRAGVVQHASEMTAIQRV